MIDTSPSIPIDLSLSLSLSCLQKPLTARSGVDLGRRTKKMNFLRNWFHSRSDSTQPDTVKVKKTDSILIVGGGTWGASTALHLARRGYKDVTVLDPYEIPSPIAAGNDINKIVEQGKLPMRSTKREVGGEGSLI